jgi:type I thyroxine 5'-deiodinase
VAFYVVYIEEAHPTDGWEMPSNFKEGVLIASAKTFLQRDKAAKSCVVKLGIHIPAVVDDMQDSTERAYTAWPDRLYIVDREGRVAFKSKAGPFGFDPKAMAARLESLVPSSTR